MGLCFSSSAAGKKKKKKSRSNNLYGGGGGKVELEDDSVLHRNPDRKYINSFSQVACLYTQQGMKGTNQDSMLLWEEHQNASTTTINKRGNSRLHLFNGFWNDLLDLLSFLLNFCSREDTIFCGVFDGHGPYGHMVSKRVRDSLPLKLCSQWESVDDADETASITMDYEWCHSNVNENEKQLPDIGTTAVTLVKQGRDLIIGNVGDSRAVLAMREDDNTLVPVQLTVDLKPNLPREAARIQKCKGRVFAMHDEPEVSRVWLPNNDSPGLAMARAFGDFCLKDFGLISVPDVSYRCLSDKDEFVVLATDGIWDVLSNKEVVDIVASAPSRSTAARAVVECAVRAWRLKFPTSKSDDCAVVCLFLETENDPITRAEAEAEEISKEVYVVGRNSDEIVAVTEELEEKTVNINMNMRSQSTRSLAECISTAEEEEWSALEGVTRVNSLLTLPRFPPAQKDDKRSATATGNGNKWF